MAKNTKKIKKDLKRTLQIKTWHKFGTPITN